MVKPFLEPKTSKKVIFVYRDNPRSHMVIEEHLYMDKLESYFSGKKYDWIQLPSLCSENERR